MSIVMARSVPAFLLVFLGPAAALPGASAEEPGSRHATSAGEFLAADALELFQKGAHVEAARKYDQAHQLDPSWVYAWNAARCLEESGAPEEAWGRFVRVLEQPGLAPEKVEEGRRRVAALQQRLGFLALSCQPPRALALISNEQGARQVRCRKGLTAVLPGSYLLTLSAEHHTPGLVPVSVAAGQTVPVRIVLEKQTGRLVVRAPVEGGDVVVDGQPRGVTDLELELPAGPHHVSVAFFRLGIWQQEVEILPEQSRLVIARPPLLRVQDPTLVREEVSPGQGLLQNRGVLLMGAFSTEVIAIGLLAGGLFRWLQATDLHHEYETKPSPEKREEILDLIDQHRTLTLLGYCFTAASAVLFGLTLRTSSGDPGERAGTSHAELGREGMVLRGTF